MKRSSQSQSSQRYKRRKTMSRKATKMKKHEARLIPGLSRSVCGFPNSIITKLRYCTFLDLTAASGTVSGNLFAANGIFDPDITGVGHQPLYRDNYASLYDQYAVIGSKITVEFTSASATLGQYVGITGDDDSTTSNNLETLMEQNNTTCCMVGAAGSPTVTLVATFDPLSAFGVDVKDDGASQTAVGSNPTELWCWKVWALPADAATVVPCYIRVQIEYTVKFAELQTPIQN